jgi:hypothetical protein
VVCEGVAVALGLEDGVPTTCEDVALGFVVAALLGVATCDALGAVTGIGVLAVLAALVSARGTEADGGVVGALALVTLALGVGAGSVP